MSFSTGQNFTVGTGPYCLAIGDIDGDNKLDIVVANNGSLTGDGTTVSVLRNTSTSGNISFASKVDFTVGNGPRVVAIGDLDKDNKKDVVVTNFGNKDGTTVSVLRNTSSSGSISFELKEDFTVGLAPHGIAIGDLDNDTYIDIVVTNFLETTISVLRNISTSGNINFASKQDYTVGTAPHGVAIGDLDGDTDPDLAAVNYGTGGNGNTISVLLNAPNHTVTFNSNGGTGSMSPQIANVPTALTLNTFTRSGYNFAGWNTAANGSGTAYANGATYSFAADITLYAQWTTLPEPHRDLQQQRRDRLDESPDRQRPDGIDAQHLHPDRLLVQRLEHSCQWLGHCLCRWRDLFLRSRHHAVCPVDGAPEPHRDLQQQRRDRLDESPDRQRPNRIDAQHLHPDRLLVQRLEHSCQWLRHCLCQRRDLFLRGRHHPVRPVDGAAEPHRDLQQQRRDRLDESPDRQRPDRLDAQHLHPDRLLVQRLEHGCQRLGHCLCQRRNLLLRGGHHPVCPVDGGPTTP